MAVVIRFARKGKKNTPFYRVVAADKQYPRDGRFLEILGTYDPKTKKAQLKTARAQLEKVAANFGYTLEELLSGKSVETVEDAPVKPRKPVEIRYRNPANEAETWTGRGKQPRWLAAAIASGKNLQDFAI